MENFWEESYFMHQKTWSCFSRILRYLYVGRFTWFWCSLRFNNAFKVKLFFSIAIILYTYWNDEYNIHFYPSFKLLLYLHPSIIRFVWMKFWLIKQTWLKPTNGRAITKPAIIDGNFTVSGLNYDSLASTITQLLKSQPFPDSFHKHLSNNVNDPVQLWRRCHDFSYPAFSRHVYQCQFSSGVTCCRSATSSVVAIWWSLQDLERWIMCASSWKAPFPPVY